MTRASTIAPIPSPPGLSDCPANRSIMALKNYVATREGYSSWLDRSVTFGDLSDLDLLNKAGLTYTALKTGDTEGPAPPTNLVVTPGVWYDHLSWTNPTDDDFSHIEVWVSTSPTLETAHLAAIVSAPQNTYDYPISDVTADYYFWIRAVDFAGNPSLFYPRSDQTGVEAPGEDTIGERIDDIMDLLKGQTPNTPTYDPNATYHSGDRIVYNDGSYDKVYQCFYDNGGAGVSGVAPDDPDGKDYWVRVGIVIEGDVDGVPTVGIDGNTVIDGSLMARSLNVDQSLVVGDKIQIADGAIHINHIGDDGDILNINQQWSDIDGAGKPADYADVTAAQFDNSLTEIDSGTDRALSGLNASAMITKAVKGKILAGTPDEAGLWLTGQYFGYYDGSSWPAYIDNQGQFFFGKDDYNYFAYTGGNLVYRNNQKGAFYILEGGDIIFVPSPTDPATIKFDFSNPMFLGGGGTDQYLMLWSLNHGTTMFNIGSKPGDTVWPIGSFLVQTEGNIELMCVTRTGVGMGTIRSEMRLSPNYAYLFGKDYIEINTPYLKASYNTPSIGSASYPFGDLFLTGNIGDSSNYIGYLYAGHIYSGTIYPRPGQTVNIGASTYPFNSIYANTRFRMVIGSDYYELANSYASSGEKSTKAGYIKVILSGGQTRYIQLYT